MSGHPQTEGDTIEVGFLKKVWILFTGLMGLVLLRLLAKDSFIQYKTLWFPGIKDIAKLFFTWSITGNNKETFHSKKLK